MAAAEIIKALRMSLCIEQEKFGKCLGVTRGTVCNWEAGRRVPQLTMIGKIRGLAKKNGIKAPRAEDFLNEG